MFLFGTGLLTVSFFRKYSGDLIPYPVLFYLLGLTMFVGAALFLRYTPKTNDLNVYNLIAERINYLKANGEKIEVDFTQCEIKENNYTEEREKYGNSNDLLTFDFERRIQLFNALGGESWRNVEQVEVIQSVIVYSYQNKRDGEIERFVSRVIPKDKITLSFYLDRQKQTTLYVDKANRASYYFDLDFLNNKN